MIVSIILCRGKITYKTRRENKIMSIEESISTIQWQRAFHGIVLRIRENKFTSVRDGKELKFSIIFSRMRDC